MAASESDVAQMFRVSSQAEVIDSLCCAVLLCCDCESRSFRLEIAIFQEIQPD